MKLDVGPLKGLQEEEMIKQQSLWKPHFGAHANSRSQSLGLRFPLKTSLSVDYVLELAYQSVRYMYQPHRHKPHKLFYFTMSSGTESYRTFNLNSLRTSFLRDFQAVYNERQEKRDRDKMFVSFKLTLSFWGYTVTNWRLSRSNLT